MSGEESLVGISEYLFNDVPGFNGILKQRFSDFIVREISVEDEVCYLNGMNDEDFEAREFEEIKVEEEVFEDEEFTETNNPIDNLISQLLSAYHENPADTSTLKEPENLRNFLEIAYKKNLENNADIKKDLLDFVGFPSSNKVVRNSLHNLIKKFPKSGLDSQTASVNGESCFKLFLKSKKNATVIKRKHTNKANEWNLKNKDSKKHFLKFKLLKENVDTMTAINLLSKLLHINSDNFHYAGTKDKRGVTCQHITVHQKKPSIFKRINAYNSFNSCLRVGDFELVEDHIKLGDLNGNLFEITLRNVHLFESKKKNEAILNAGPENNYGEDLSIFEDVGKEFDILSQASADNFDEIFKQFQENIFKSSAQPLETVEETEVKLDQENKKSVLEFNLNKLKEGLLNVGYLNYFGLQRFGRGGTPSHLIGLAIFKGNYKLCIDYLFRPKKNESDELIDIKKAYFKKDYATALKLLNNYHKSNYLLNEKKVLIKLIKNPKDYCGAYNSIHKFSRLICLHSLQSYVFNKVLSHRVKLFGYKLIAGDLVIKNKEVLNAKPETEEETSEQNNEEEPASKKTKLEETEKEEAPVSESDDINDYVHVVTEEDIKNNTYTIHDIVLPLIGFSSIFPENDQIKAYAENLLKAMDISLNSFKDCLPVYQLRGSYRLIFERPKQFDYKIISYTSTDAEINSTEISKFKKEITKNNRRNNNNNAEAKQAEEVKAEEVKAEEVKAEEVKAEEVKAEEYTGVIFKFALSPGSYATMLLRECTKQSTETDYQALLTSKHK